MSNPFAALLFDSSDEESLVTVQSTKADHTFQNNDDNKEKVKINNILENVFLITLNHSTKSELQLIYLEDMSKSTNAVFLDLDLLEQALFERILLENLEQFVIPKNNTINQSTCEKEVLIYLYDCYNRLDTYSCQANVKAVSSDLIIRNAVLALKQPGLFENQDVISQLYKILKLKGNKEICEAFFIGISTNFHIEDGVSFQEIFFTLLEMIHRDVANFSLANMDPHIYQALCVLTCNEKYANVFLDYSAPANWKKGIAFMDTLIGSLLSISVLPKNAAGKYEYFLDAADKFSIESDKSLLWSCNSQLSAILSSIFLKCLTCSKSIKSKTLTWIAKCLKANANRGKLWNSQMMAFQPMQFSTATDGFMINLNCVLAKLCQPFCNNDKILKVDPTYCAVPDEECESKDIYLQLSSETCLVPHAIIDDNNESSSLSVPSASMIRPTSDSYNFITNCFHLAHKSFDLSFRVCAEQLIKINQEINQIETAYNEAMNQATAHSDILDTIKLQLKTSITKFASMQTALLEPEQLKVLSQFFAATATWLVQISINTDIPNDSNTYAPVQYRLLNFPLQEQVPDTLKCIPEFIVDNVVCYLNFLRRFSPETLEGEYMLLESILTMVIIFMRSPERMRNPHLRAGMAQCLEAILPTYNGTNNDSIRIYERKRLFEEHAHRNEIVRSLLEVFVSIEMTGQSVQFEQKFNYRRPMYSVMKYLWQLEEQRHHFKQLADEAEKNMEAVNPPLFLRFINLLVNDAVYLLDESLSNMAQLRNMQTARENGEWNTLPREERVQNISYIHHIGMIARFDNILGRKTIHTLEFLTSEIKSIFTHPTMVHRVAAMLNYFLLQLVGPDNKNFKVKDMNEYDFDPAKTVTSICKIYVHLYSSDAFCVAVSQDGRSYSPQLFSLAEHVLARIGGGLLISELQLVATKISEIASQQQTEEEALAEAPEEFLDPIMSTLMTDPVMLPSSRQTVDRTTIARHLLSDQSDPFNRSPLTMDQVIPDTELAERIQQWIAEKKNKRN